VPLAPELLEEKQLKLIEASKVPTLNHKKHTQTHKALKKKKKKTSHVPNELINREHHTFGIKPLYLYSFNKVCTWIHTTLFSRIHSKLQQ
jgi:hypothetical protein